MLVLAHNMRYTLYFSIQKGFAVKWCRIYVETLERVIMNELGTHSFIHDGSYLLPRSPQSFTCDRTRKGRYTY